MADSVTTPIRHARRILPVTIKNAVMTFQVGDGMVHRERASSCWSYKNATDKSTKRIALDELTPSKTCDMCLRARMVSYSLGSVGDLIEAVSRASTALKKSLTAKHKDGRSVLRAQTKILTEYEDAKRYSSEVHPDEVKAYADFLMTLKAEHSRLARLLQSPEQRQEALDLVKAALVGEDEWTHGYVFDQTPTLVGITNYKKNGWNRTFLVLASQFAVQEAPLVLLVPRYVADYILLSTSNSKEQGLGLPAGAQDLTDAQLETALGLWDPENKDSMASLAGAVEAARRI